MGKEEFLEKGENTNAIINARSGDAIWLRFGWETLRAVTVYDVSVVSNWSSRLSDFQNAMPPATTSLIYTDILFPGISLNYFAYDHSQPEM